MGTTTQQPSRWLTALAVVAALIVVLFIMGFWEVVYTPGAASLCSGPFTLMEVLALMLAVAGAYLLMNYLGKGRVSDLVLVAFVVLVVVFVVSLYLLSASSPYASVC